MQAQKWQKDTVYLEIVGDLLAHPQVQLLKNYVQHHHSDRLQHSIDVSYLSYRIALRYGLNATAVARAGLLHDLFFYDWRVTKFELGTHAFIHPRVAFRNAEKITALSPMEKDIILKHMWGATSALPHFRESLLVDLVDDWVALVDFFAPKWRKIRNLLKK
ncbi:HD superfamily metal-dependent phosphohydrolase [Weissella oryzae SG25]|uniref:HD superfamily metal-dependent phosphohydrolase n=1 Tax=Weissella oryzae (strain DSM 25784 / JCM 18191 / LMG 30913 / SG25) TaxID=1329250 RepID=A0A069D207_WEIOS|nr:HD domain-containing protein [Weissella oryzae]GAK31406.1 HD superfamily metal-dependent phosphohydrolase [Weissella oryzae SG25]